MTKNEPVHFLAYLHDRADAFAAKGGLESLATDIRVTIFGFKDIIDDLNPQFVAGITSQATYENVFGAQLDYVPKTIPNLIFGSQQAWEWVEKQPARVPQGLEQYIRAITLEEKAYVMDS